MPRVERTTLASILRKPAASACPRPCEEGLLDAGFAAPVGRGRGGGVARLPLRCFGEDLVGAILDVTYLDPPCVYRVRVVRFCPKTGWHTVNSEGLSMWDGDSFTDRIDVNQMNAAGQIQIVGDSERTRTPWGMTRFMGPEEGAGAQRASQKRTIVAEVINNRPKKEGRKRPRVCNRSFGEDIVGSILELTYGDPPTTYRMRVTAFDGLRGWHTVDSRGLSAWDGEDFLDVVDVGQMYALGAVRFVDEADPGKDASAAAAALRTLRNAPATASRGRRGGRGSAAVASSGAVASSNAAAPAPDNEDAGFPTGNDLCGHVVDVTYEDPPATFRARVLSFDRKTGWHKIDSKGYSIWEGDTFRDTVDLMAMRRAGQVRLVARAEEEPAIPVVPAPSRPSAPGKSYSRGCGRGRRQGTGGGAAVRGRKGGRAPTTEPVACDPAADSDVEPPHTEPPPAEETIGEDLIGRMIDVTLPEDTGSGSGQVTHRLCVVAFDVETGLHEVEPLGADPAEGPSELNLQELSRAGRVEFVDGQDELLRHGHVLLGEEIRFLPSEGDAGPGEGLWLVASIVGWWPQDVVPPVASQRSLGGPREAVFVAEDTDGDRWQLSLGDAILAMVSTPDARPPVRTARVLEVFAGSCALSVEFWRCGVEAEMYDLRLSERQDFRTDDLLLKQLAASDMDLVHLSPPESLARDAASMRRLLRALETVRGRGGGFVVECGEHYEIWRTTEMQQAANLEGTEELLLDFLDFGAAQSAPTRLLTNCAGWLRPALASCLSAFRKGKPRQKGPMPDEDQQYPRAFVEAYVRGAIQALRL